LKGFVLLLSTKDAADMANKETKANLFKELGSLLA
jgi:hypothetical protein